MPSQNRSQNADEAMGFLKDLIRQFRLLWRLLKDPRVPYWVKAIPAAVLLYLIFPIDLIPDPVLGLGQLDDLAIILLGLKLFRDLSPQTVVRDHEADIVGPSSPWRVVEDESAAGQGTKPATIDAEYRIVDKD